MASLIHLVNRSGSVDHRRLRPVDDMVLLSCVVKFWVIILVVFDEFN